MLRLISKKRMLQADRNSWSYQTRGATNGNFTILTLFDESTDVMSSFRRNINTYNDYILCRPLNSVKISFNLRALIQ